MTKTVDEILAPKPEARPRIYAYAIDDAAHQGLLKVGQTTRDVTQRVAEQVKTAAQQVAIAKQKAYIGPNEPVKLLRFRVQRHH